MIGCGRIASSIDDERTPQWRGGVVPPLAHAGGYAETTDVTELVAACDVDTRSSRSFGGAGTCRAGTGTSVS
ncbi:hypothetical protein GBAR_LOCUS24264 [Geodia barretti]|uniref:Uncharacterized protein n=1 Tax=Geodia barretti TaxID=519541 RepID=A0AA35X9Z0_GEOBA|nr:hypothetical protein GBAR_LOCUS24264 [Geodia barretti]